MALRATITIGYICIITMDKRHRLIDTWSFALVAIGIGCKPASQVRYPAHTGTMTSATAQHSPGLLMNQFAQFMDFLLHFLGDELPRGTGIGMRHIRFIFLKTQARIWMLGIAHHAFFQIQIRQ